MRIRTLRSVLMAFALTALGTMPSMAHAQVDKGDAKIAEDAFIYGFPMVMNYAVFYDYFTDKSSPGYSEPIDRLGQLVAILRVYGPLERFVTKKGG